MLAAIEKRLGDSIQSAYEENKVEPGDLHFRIAIVLGKTWEAMTTGELDEEVMNMVLTLKAQFGEGLDIEGD